MDSLENQMKTINILAILVATCMLIGCGTGRGGAVEPGKSRVLGEVSYDDAFAAAKGIMSQEYEIASADSVTGVIRGEPKSVQAKSERLLGGPSQSRELATMRILQHRTYVVAELTIAIQKQGQDIQTIQAGSNSYSGVPDQTPAQIDASTTPQQNSDWNTVRYATDKETLMLDQLYRAMQGRVTTQPKE